MYLTKGDSPTMKSHRVILANESRLLREMLERAINKAPDLEVVGQLTDFARLPSLLENTDAQAVILPLLPTGKIPGVADSLLAEHPSLQVLAIAADGSQVKAKWLEPHEKDLGDLSLGELIAILEDGRPEK
jgi:chemotaxis response regulator CheB